jgi:hypothetical protein
MSLKKSHRVNDYALIRHWVRNLDGTGNAFWTVRKTIRTFHDTDSEALLNRAMNYLRGSS